MTEQLTDLQLELIHFIERFHSQEGRAPTDDELNRRFENLTPQILEELKVSPLVQRSFRARGILFPAGVDTFTPEQMHAASVMMDLVDRRSDEKKLRDMGISTRQWSQWLLDDRFADYMRNRSEKLIQNSIHEAHKGLMKGVRQGSVASVKTFYELTGRYRPNEEAQVDVRRILYTFVEIIQRYVKDPVILNQISMDLSRVASAETMSQQVGRPTQIVTAKALPTPGELSEMDFS